MFTPQDIENKKTSDAIVVAARKENGLVVKNGDVFTANNGNILVPLINHQNAPQHSRNVSINGKKDELPRIMNVFLNLSNHRKSALLPFLEQKSPARKRAIPTDQTPRKRQDRTTRAAKKYTPPPQVSAPSEYDSPPINPFAVNQPPGVETPPDMRTELAAKDESEEEGESLHQKRMRLL